MPIIEDFDAVPLAGHALDKFMFIELFAEIGARILDATIRMKDEPLARTTSSNRPFQRRYHHLMAQRAAQRPADHHTREQIDDHRQVQPTRPGGQVRDIRHPYLVRSLCSKVSLKQIWRHGKMMLAVGGHTEASHRSASTCSIIRLADSEPKSEARLAFSLACS